MNVSHASPLPSGLIGHTGFVGSALLRQTWFDARYNSANIAGITGARFGTLVCAAAPGSMIEANRAPERDEAAINALIAQLDKVEAERFVLISSIAVLADFAGGDDEGTGAFQQELAYGRHRRALEAFVEQRFASHLIVRLPALFGAGLRKNFLFDLLNPVPAMLTEARHAALVAALDGALSGWFAALYTPDAATGLLKVDRATLLADPRRAALEAALDAMGATATQFHHRETTYQYYNTDRLWQDIGIAQGAGLSHLHLAPEPLAAATIHQRLLGRPMPETPARLHREDMRTAHAALWGASGPYQFAATETLDQLAAFFAGQRGGCGVILSMSNIAWAPDERLEAYAILAQAGFAGLEIAPGLFFHAAEDAFLPDEATAAEALAEIADAGLTLVSMQSLLFGVTGAALFEGAEARAAFEAGMHRAISLAGRFGIPNLVFGSPLQRRVPDGMAMEDALDQAAAVFRTLGNAAMAAGTRIAIEANPAAYGTNFCTTLGEAEGFVGLVDHPAVVPHLDLGAMHMNGDFASVPARLPDLAPRLGHVHVSEPDLAPAPADPAALAPVLAGLAAAGYNRAVSIEMKRASDGLAAVRQAVAGLAQARDAMEAAHA